MTKRSKDTTHAVFGSDDARPMDTVGTWQMVRMVLTVMVWLWSPIAWGELVKVVGPTLSGWPRLAWAAAGGVGVMAMLLAGLFLVTWGNDTKFSRRELLRFAVGGLVGGTAVLYELLWICSSECR